MEYQEEPARNRACFGSIHEPTLIDWGGLAGSAGYFDQDHFGHEFRAFTGLTPMRYVEVRRRSWRRDAPARARWLGPEAPFQI